MSRPLTSAWLQASYGATGLNIFLIDNDDLYSAFSYERIMGTEFLRAFFYRESHKNVEAGSPMVLPLLTAGGPK
jgi:hypothetical protein